MSFDSSISFSLKSLEIYRGEKAHGNPNVYLKINESKFLEVTALKDQEAPLTILSLVISDLATLIFENCSNISKDLLRDAEGSLKKEPALNLNEAGKYFAELISQAYSLSLGQEPITDSVKQIETLIDFINLNNKERLCHLNEDIFQQISDFISTKELSEIRSTSKQFERLMLSKRQAIIFKQLPTEEQMASLLRYPNLKILDFSRVHHAIDDKTIESLLTILKGKTDLKRISFEACSKITADTLAMISTFEGLESLDLTGCYKLNNESLIRLLTLKGLKELSLSAGYSYTDEALSILAPLTELEVLNLSYNPEISARGLSYLEALPKLKTLIFEECSIGDEAVEALVPLKNLRILNLFQCTSVTNRGLAAISSLTQLEALDLSFCTIDTSAVAHLSNLKQLKFLSLQGCYRLFSEALSDLTTLQNLEVLNLSGCYNLDDRIFEFIASLKNLKVLNINGVRNINDAGLSILLGSDSLIKIYINDCYKISEELKTLFRVEKRVDIL